LDYLITGKEKSVDGKSNFEKFSKILDEKGLSERDIENLSNEQLVSLVNIVKNFKQ